MLLLTYLDSNKLDHYARLGVTRDCTRRDIELAYRRASRRAHPDNGGTRAEWDALREAYETLTDPQRRFAYDALDMNERELRDAIQVMVDIVVAGYGEGLTTQKELRTFVGAVVRANIQEQKQEIKKATREIKLLNRFVDDADCNNYVMSLAVDNAQFKIAHIGRTLDSFNRIVRCFENAQKLIPHLTTLVKDHPPAPQSTQAQPAFFSWRTR